MDWDPLQKPQLKVDGSITSISLLWNTYIQKGTSADKAIAQLNLAIQELCSWCLTNKLTPHPGKSEAMLISRKSHMRPIPPILIGGHTIKWMNKHAYRRWQLPQTQLDPPYTGPQKEFCQQTMFTQEAKVSAKKNASGFLFEGYFAYHDLWPYFMGCLVQLRYYEFFRKAAL